MKRGSADPASGRSNLGLRLATASIGLPAVALLAWLGGWPFAVFVSVVAFLAGLEFLRGWLLPALPLTAAARLWAVPAAAAVTVLLGHWEPRAVAVGFFLALCCAALGYGPVPARIDAYAYRVFSWCLGYTGILVSTGVLLRDLAYGRDWVFLAVLATFTTDTGAYATGRLMGRRALAPSISPGKTVEGAIGGFVAGAVGVLVLGWLLSVQPGRTGLALLAILLPVGAQLGDLGESWMKRRMGIKDSSRILPGHGGLLDRLDSLVVSIPITYVVASLLGS